MTHTHAHTRGTHMDCTVQTDGSIFLVIDEWVGECTVWFWKSRSSNNDHMDMCQGCSMLVPLAYGLHVYAEEPQPSRIRTSRQRWYTDKPAQWTDLSGKWLCVRSHSLFLMRSMSTGTRIVTCRLSRAGAASWVDFTDNRSTLTVACSCCACRNMPHDIQCSSKRHAHCHRDVVWDSTVVGAWTAWPSDFEIIHHWCHTVICQRQASCHHPMILEHCNGYVGCFTLRLQGCFPYVESTTCFSPQQG